MNYTFNCKLCLTEQECWTDPGDLYLIEVPMECSMCNRKLSIDERDALYEKAIRHNTEEKATMGGQL